MVKLLDLASQIAQHERHRQVVVGIVVVDAKVGGKSHSREIGIIRQHHFHVDATAQIVGYVMRIGHVKSHIACTEFACYRAVNIGFGQLAVAIILYSSGYGSVLAESLPIARTHKICRAYVVHVAQAHLLVKLRSEQRRVLVHKIYVVVNDGYVVPSKPINPCRRTDVEKLIGRGAVLR